MPIMDFFGTGEAGGLSIQDMIDIDMKSEFSDHLLDGDPLISAKPLSVSISDPLHHSSLDSLLSSPDDLKGMGDMSWLQQTVNVNEIQGIVMPENTNPNLLVNPQTGMPTAATPPTPTSPSAGSQPLSPAITLTQGSSLGSLGNAIIHPTPNHSAPQTVASALKFVNASPSVTAAVTGNASISLNSASSPVVSQPTTITYMQATPVAVNSNSNGVASNHQTLTQHLLSNNNHQHKLTVKPEKSYPKPVYSYSCLIAMALKNSDTGALPVSEIYSFMTENFPYFKNAPDGWKNSVRHNLSLNKCFEKIENPKASASATSRKGCLWGLNPAKIDKMDEEITKWRKKDPISVKRSMSHPERLEEIEKGNLISHWPHHPNNIRNAAFQRSDSLHLLHSPVSSTHGSTDGSAPSTPTKPSSVQVSLIEIRPDQAIRTVKLDPAQVIQTSNVLTSAGTHAVNLVTAAAGAVKMEPVTMQQNEVIYIKNEPDVIRDDTTPPSSQHMEEEEDDEEGESSDSGHEDMDLSQSGLIDPSLTDIALTVESGIWDELSSEGITLDDLPISSSNGLFSFSTNSLTSSPAPTGLTGVGA